MIGVSRDSVAAHDKFKKKYELPFILASDADGKVTESYGVWVEKSMYGRKYMGIERATFLIDEKGVVRKVWHKVKVPGHVDEVLAAAEGAVSRRRSPTPRARCCAPPSPRRRSRSAAALRRGTGARARSRVGRRRAAARPPGAAGAAGAAAAARHAAPPRRGLARAGRIALLHALAHIELNAIDLAWDLIARFAAPRPAARILRRLGRGRGRGGEAFRAARRAARRRSAPPMAICRRMTGCGRRRQATAHDLLARLAVVPLVLEARGLDVTPEMIERLERAGDDDSAAVLEVIYRRRDRPCRGRRALVPLGLRAARRSSPRRAYRELVRAPFQRRAEAALQPRRPPATSGPSEARVHIRAVD